MSKHYIIIGNSTAGLFALKTIREKDIAGNITLVSDEPCMAYSRVLLTNYLAGEIEYGQLFLTDQAFYNRFMVNLVVGVKVVSVEPGTKKVLLANGKAIKYDSLLLATGSRPYFPKQISPSSEGVFGFRNLNDATAIKNKIRKDTKIIVLGGGPSGIKIACALRKAGAAPELIVSSPHILSQVTDDESAKIIHSRLESHGISIRTGISIKSLLTNKSRIQGVKLDNGQTIDCCALVVCKGVCPNSELLTEYTSESGAIKVDKLMRTPVHNVYAAGDVVETYDIAYRKYCNAATWPHASLQGRVAGSNMAGVKKLYRGTLSRNAIEIMGLPLITIGVINAPNLEGWEVQYVPGGSTSYRKLIYRDGILAGAILLGEVEDAGLLHSEIRRNNTNLTAGMRE